MEQNKSNIKIFVRRDFMKVKKKSSFLKLLMISIIFIFSMSVTSIGVLADSKGIMLLDDYNREALGVTGNGGAYNSPNSAGVTIYWISMANTAAEIQNNAVKVTMGAKGWFGEGAAIKDPTFKYIIMKVKGEKGGEEKALSINPDAKGSKNFTDLKGPDGNPVPAITKDYQNIIIDIEKSGFKLPKGFEAMHFNNTDAVTIYIDEIYLSKDGVPVDLSKEIPAATTSDNSGTDSKDSSASSSSISTSSEASSTSADTIKANKAKASTTSNSSSNNKPILIGVIILVMVLATGGVIYNSFIKKPNSEK
jgi:hypothetical protein